LEINGYKLTEIYAPRYSETITITDEEVEFVISTNANPRKVHKEVSSCRPEIY